MRRGERSGKTHNREAVAEHFAIKSREPPPNEAHYRLQLSPSDPRWDMKPPFGWVELHPGQRVPGAVHGSRCWYCALNVSFSEIVLYSRRLSFIAHVECFADGDESGDTNTPKRVTVDST